jgi:hypothetical protein
VTGPRISKARRSALAVGLYIARHRSDRVFRESNLTTDVGDVHTAPGSTVPAIYWQSLAWMLHEGLAEPVGAPARRVFRLTAAGRQLAEQIEAA